MSYRPLNVFVNELTQYLRVLCNSHKLNHYWELHGTFTIKLVTGHDVLGQSTDEVLGKAKHR